MIELAFRIEFATPFRVSTGAGGDGMDATVDTSEPLPASSLKGVMRATAGLLIGPSCELVGAVFGTAAHPSPWAWSTATPVGDDWGNPRPASRIKLSAEHSAEHDMLMIAEEIHASAATFNVRQRAPLTPHALARHRALLAVSAVATRSLGANRRRGLGWVHIGMLDGPPGRPEVELVLSEENP